MSQEIEIEFKNLLTKSEFSALHDFFRSFSKEEMTQMNHYFETETFSLKNNGAALRIREKGNHFSATLKQPNPLGPGLLETHQDISVNEADQWFQNKIQPDIEIADALSHLGVDVKQLRYGGKLETTRTELAYQDVLVVLDHSRYNGREDYELELECKEEKQGLAVFHQLLEQFHIPERKTMNKIARFYHTL
ncbi:CYTH domain-containing protein [Gracilibacillus oryzae]|uniref:CYTH domain-containing protein n=1 Tax=Gracilibacillus oryzae TaxID=1672701 RepID=A0A7C8GWJ9_9BACI|nr:CYTH domain-containing protein [Gracilibacillus oryzae]KAB8139099.1 CYTH domain-containing protein [Gracilibacillus oryzae]